mgnify:CR=1 FL=1
MQKHFLTIIIVLVLFSCSKDRNISIDDRNEAILGQWEYEAIDSDTAVDINGDGTVNIDLYNTNEIRQCLKDNLTFFASRGEGELNEFTINENETVLLTVEVDQRSARRPDFSPLNKDFHFLGSKQMSVSSHTNGS